MKARAKGEKQDVDRLKEFPAFAQFSDEELTTLVRAAHHTSTSGPWPLIHERTPSDACFILLTGDAVVYLGRDRIAELSAGEVLGENALRRGKLRSATVTTTGPAEVLRIGRDDFARLLEQIPALRGMVDDTIARHMAGEPAGE